MIGIQHHQDFLLRPLSISLNQPDASTNKGNPGNAAKADRVQRVAEPAEVVEQQGGKHLAGKDCCYHGGGAELGNQDDGRGDEEGAESPTSPDPPGVPTNCCNSG